MRVNNFQILLLLSAFTTITFASSLQSSPSSDDSITIDTPSEAPHNPLNTTSLSQHVRPTFTDKASGLEFDNMQSVDWEQPTCGPTFDDDNTNVPLNIIQHGVNYLNDHTSPMNIPAGECKIVSYEWSCKIEWCNDYPYMIEMDNGFQL